MPPSNKHSGRERLLPKNGGYRHLKSFQVARLVYDVTLRFCDRYIDQRSRTHDQMVQAARSGVQNIAEGSAASGTSKKFELKLTNVARASLEELRLDYEDFLRHRGLKLWGTDDPRRKMLVARRCATADEVAAWVREMAIREAEAAYGLYGLHGRNEQNISTDPSISSMKSIRSILFPQISANAALILIGVACALLSRQVATLAEAFEKEGGFTERLYRVRTANRKRRL